MSRKSCWMCWLQSSISTGVNRQYNYNCQVGNLNFSRIWVYGFCWPWSSAGNGINCKHLIKSLCITVLLNNSLLLCWKHKETPLIIEIIEVMILLMDKSRGMYLMMFIFSPSLLLSPYFPLPPSLSLPLFPFHPHAFLPSPGPCRSPSVHRAQGWPPASAQLSSARPASGPLSHFPAASPQKWLQPAQPFEPVLSGWVGRQAADWLPCRGVYWWFLRGSVQGRGGVPGPGSDHCWSS